MKNFIKGLDLLSWDTALPLIVILAFALWAAVIAGGVMEFGIPLELDAYIQIYVALGVQTTAGIFAIIVTLSLVAIQFASQEYSHRIMEAYIRSVMLWSTIAVFFLVMASNVVLFSSQDVSSNRTMTSISVVGTILSFALLVPHFLVTAAYLRPEFIIVKLLRRVDRNYLETMARATRTNRRWVGSNADRLLPVIEIIERSIDKGDVTTTRAALERIHDTYSRHTPGIGLAQVQKYFIDYLLRIGRKAISESDEEASAIQVIDIMGTIGASDAPDAAVEAIGILGMSALKKEFDPVVHQMIDALHAVSESGATAETRGAVLDLYDDLAGDLVVGERHRLLEHVTTRVAEMADAAFKVKHQALLERCLRLLEMIGHDSAGHNMVDVTLQVARALQKLGVEVAREDVNAADRIVRIMLRVERPVDMREREPLAQMEFAKREVERAIEKARSERAGPPTSQPAAAPPAATLQPDDERQAAPAPPPGLWNEAVADDTVENTPSPLAGLWGSPAAPAAAATSPGVPEHGADGAQPVPGARADEAMAASRDGNLEGPPAPAGDGGISGLWDSPTPATQESQAASPPPADSGSPQDAGVLPDGDLWGGDNSEQADKQPPGEPPGTGRTEKRKDKQAQAPEGPLSPASLWSESQEE